MRSPIDVVKGRIVDVNEHGEVTIKVQYDDWYTLTKRGYKECLVQMIDSRPLSDKQRRTCYALLGAIADFTGDGLDRTKEYQKLKFLIEDQQSTADHLFSLSNAPMSLVCAFERYLVDFILGWDIPCKIPLLKFVDDVRDYTYSCMVHKKCCICGKAAELHHMDRVGMGRSRAEVMHEGMEAMPLCREHHNECHMMGQKSFEDKYHLEGGIILDKTLCRLYRLGRRRNVKSNNDNGAADG